MDIFAEFRARIATILKARIADGRLPADMDLARFVVEIGRAHV